MEFYNQNNLPPKEPSPSGSPWREKFTLQKNEETGLWEKVSTGKTNVQDKINAAADSTRIYNIIEKFENGEIGTLVQKQGVYADVNNLPKTVFEAQEATQQATNQLPSELRQILIKKGTITEQDIANYVNAISKKEEEQVSE